MRMLRMNTNKIYNKFSGGFTLIEMAIVLAILGLLVAIVIPSFGKIGGSEALDTTALSVVAILQGANSSARSSDHASDYGVRISNDKLTSFRDAYGTENKEYSISNLITISTSTGIGTDIIFNNVSGTTTASGTITMTVLNDQTKTSIIRIYPTGVVERN